MSHLLALCACWPCRRTGSRNLHRHWRTSHDERLVSPAEFEYGSDWVRQRFGFLPPTFFDFVSFSFAHMWRPATKQITGTNDSESILANNSCDCRLISDFSPPRWKSSPLRPSARGRISPAAVSSTISFRLSTSARG